MRRNGRKGYSTNQIRPDVYVTILVAVLTRETKLFKSRGASGVQCWELQVGNMLDVLFHSHVHIRFDFCPLESLSREFTSIPFVSLNCGAITRSGG
jgi:hypothetical protein